MRGNIPPYFFWSVWRNFSTWERLFLVVLVVIIGYTLYSAAVTVLGVRRDKAQAERGFYALHRRSMRLQRLIGAAFYLFGIVLFLSLQWSYITVDNSNIPGGILVLENFAIHFIFAFNVFIVFLILHVVAWFVAGQVDHVGSRLKPRDYPSALG